VALKLHARSVVGQQSRENRRQDVRGDRRRRSRGGRRDGDPHSNWRRVAWLFAAYALFISVRSLPETARRFFSRGNRRAA
jgi:hypothetical protein